MPSYKGAVLANVDIGSKQPFTAMLTVGHLATFLRINGNAFLSSALLKLLGILNNKAD